jgi:hypothetical protein
VCNGGRIKGQPGVAMDDLVYVCTKIARQMDAAGIDKVRAGAAAAEPLGSSWQSHHACSSEHHEHVALIRFMLINVEQGAAVTLLDGEWCHLAAGAGGNRCGDPGRGGCAPAAAACY